MDSSSLRTRSRTSRRPPLSCLTRRGLRVIASLASFDLLGPGLGGVTAEEGISSHSSPVMLTARKKNGQSEVSMETDSCASAADSGTGDDFKMASTTSYCGMALRLREAAAPPEPEGPAKSLRVMSIGLTRACRCGNSHPDTLRYVTETAK